MDTAQFLYRTCSVIIQGLHLDGEQPLIVLDILCTPLVVCVHLHQNIDKCVWIESLFTDVYLIDEV